MRQAGARRWCVPQGRSRGDINVCTRVRVEREAVHGVRVLLVRRVRGQGEGLVASSVVQQRDECDEIDRRLVVQNQLVRVIRHSCVAGRKISKRIGQNMGEKLPDVLTCFALHCAVRQYAITLVHTHRPLRRAAQLQRSSAFAEMSARAQEARTT